MHVIKGKNTHILCINLFNHSVKKNGITTIGSSQFFWRIFLCLNQLNSEAHKQK